MATVKPFPVRTAVRQHVTVELDESEYPSAQGDRDRQGNRREARAVSYGLEYRWNFNSGQWEAEPHRSSVWIQQVLQGGGWGAAKQRNGYGLDPIVFETYVPTSTVTFTVNEGPQE